MAPPVGAEDVLGQRWPGQRVPAASGEELGFPRPGDDQRPGVGEPRVLPLTAQGVDPLQGLFLGLAVGKSC